MISLHPPFKEYFVHYIYANRFFVWMHNHSTLNSNIQSGYEFCIFHVIEWSQVYECRAQKLCLWTCFVCKRSADRVFHVSVRLNFLTAIETVLAYQSFYEWIIRLHCECCYAFISDLYWFDYVSSTFHLVAALDMFVHERRFKKTDLTRWNFVRNELVCVCVCQLDLSIHIKISWISSFDWFMNDLIFLFFWSIRINIMQPA